MFFPFMTTFKNLQVPNGEIDQALTKIIEYSKNLYVEELKSTLEEVRLISSDFLNKFEVLRNSNILDKIKSILKFFASLGFFKTKQNKKKCTFLQFLAIIILQCS